jgi:hypothetical protein
MVITFFPWLFQFSARQVEFIAVNVRFYLPHLKKVVEMVPFD